MAALAAGKLKEAIQAQTAEPEAGIRLVPVPPNILLITTPVRVKETVPSICAVLSSIVSN